METDKILPELQAEKEALDPAFQHCLRLLERGESGLRSDPPPHSSQPPAMKESPLQSECSKV